MDLGRELRAERSTLIQADVDLKDGEGRVMRQWDLVSELRATGHDTREAERLADLLADTLRHWKRHRELIVHRIAHLESKVAASRAPDVE